MLQEALVILQEEANQLAEDKTHGDHLNPTNYLPLNIYATRKYCLSIPSHNYIGSLITNHGSSSRDITSRIAKAASAMDRPLNPLFRKHRISIRTKINMVRALVVSVLVYGSEAWTTTLVDRSRMMFAIVAECRSFRTFRDCHTSIAFTTVGPQPNWAHIFE